MSTPGWQQRAAAKRDAVNDLIPKAWRVADAPTAEKQPDITGSYLHQYLDAAEVEITESAPELILQKTASGKWTAESVTRAFAHRAALVHQHVNCLHEIFFEAALEDARKLDVYFAEHGAPIGPLHGLPVSLKDQFHVRGVETSMGYVGWLGTFQGSTGTGREKVFESEMVRELRNLGAVLYCKTSVPQTLMSTETANNVNGYTWNPKNRGLSCGGSSGGEGALIGAKGSPLGFGSDIGGSIRIPAASCGLYGLRPSHGRLPYEGTANSMDGQVSMPSVLGPLSGSIAGIRLAMEAILSQKPWLYDPLVAEIPWRHDVYQATLDASRDRGKLSFAVLWDDGGATPFPPVTRGLKRVVDALKQNGHAVIDWKPPSHKEGFDLAISIWSFDGGADVRKDAALSCEPLVPQAAVGHEIMEQSNATKIAGVNLAHRAYKKRYMDYWNSTAAMTATGQPVDAVLCPVMHWPAPRRTGHHYVAYTGIWNVLDYPALALPVGAVDKNIDRPAAGFEALNEFDRDLQSSYDADIYDGAHLSIQVVGRRLQEEKVVAMTEYISGLIQRDRGSAHL